MRGRSAAAPVFLLLLAGCGGDAVEEEPKTSRVQTAIRVTGPNVLLITMTGGRADHMSVYGHDRPTTPNLERIALEGVLYENCISPGDWTVSAHASMFTGLYPRDHGADNENPRLAREFETLPEHLWAAGYATAAVTNNANVAGRHGLLQGFEDLGLFPGHLDVPDEGAERTNEWALRWLDERLHSQQRFFLFLNYIEPSFPYEPVAPYDERFLPEGTDPAMVLDLKSWRRPRDMGYMLKVPGMGISPEQLGVLEALHEGEIAYLDARLGELLEQLSERGLLDETLLVITADVGEHLGEHGMLEHKMSLYEPIVHVPLIVRYPPAVPAGRRIQAQVQSLDIFSTILRLCDIESPPDIAARMLPFEESETGRAYTFAQLADPSRFLGHVAVQYPDADLRPWRRSLSMVRGPRYKLIEGSLGTSELYDLVADPGEERNLATDLPEVRAELEQRLRSLRSDP